MTSAPTTIPNPRRNSRNSNSNSDENNNNNNNNARSLRRQRRRGVFIPFTILLPFLVLLTVVPNLIATRSQLLQYYYESSADADADADAVSASASASAATPSHQMHRTLTRTRTLPTPTTLTSTATVESTNSITMDTRSTTAGTITSTTTIPTTDNGSKNVNDENKGKQQAKGVHVAYAAEGDQNVALFASIVSLLTNTKNPERVTVHLFVLQENEKGQTPKDNISVSIGSNSNRNSNSNITSRIANISSKSTDKVPVLDTHLLMKWVLSKKGKVQVHNFTEADVRPFVNSHVMAQRLQSPSNYVRFLLSSWLPNVDSCLWIDADTIVEGDIVPFLESRNSSFPLAAFPRDTQQLTTEAIDRIRNEFHVDVAIASPSFNAGIVVLNLKLWREKDYMKDILYLCELNDKHNLWPGFGSQPPLQLMFAGDRFEQLNPKLLFSDLGYKLTRKIRKQIFRQEGSAKSAIFLHWNGGEKPWQDRGLHKKLWAQYDKSSKFTRQIIQ